MLVLFLQAVSSNIIYTDEVTKEVVSGFRMFTESVTIPASVTEIMGSSAQETSITRDCKGTLRAVEFAPGSKLERIGNWAFYQCTMLETFTLPASFKTFGEKCFYECSGLRSFTFENGCPNLASLGRQTFCFTSSLTHIDIPEQMTSIPYACFEYAGLINVSLPKAVALLDQWSFAWCRSIVEFHIPEDSELKEIRYNSFAYLTFTKITLSAKVQTLEGNAFSYCRSLSLIDVVPNNPYFKVVGGIVYSKDGTVFVALPAGSDIVDVSVPDGVTHISDTAFNTCEKLKTVRLPATVSSISTNAFHGVTSIEAIVVDENNANYASSEGILYDKAMTKVILSPRKFTSSTLVIDYKVTSVSNSGFQGVSNIVSVTFTEPPSGSTYTLSLGSLAFSVMPHLEKIVFSRSIYSIGQNAIDRNNKLREVVFPESCQQLFLGYYAFYRDTSLKSIQLPINTVRISSYAFQQTGLTSISIPTTVSAFEVGVFQNCKSLVSVIFESKSSVKAFDKYAFQYCTALENIVFPEELTSIGASCFHQCTKLTEQIVNNLPKTVTLINPQAFAECLALTSFTIPSDTQILDQAFNLCKNLISVSVPSSVKSFDNYAFAICESLERFEVDQSNTYLVSQDGIVYSRDMKTLYAFPSGKQIPHFEVPLSVVTLQDSSFCGAAHLITINITKNVRTIGSKSFLLCNKLTCAGIIYTLDISAFQYSNAPEIALHPCPPTEMWQISQPRISRCYFPVPKSSFAYVFFHYR